MLLARMDIKAMSRLAMGFLSHRYLVSYRSDPRF